MNRTKAICTVGVLLAVAVAVGYSASAQQPARPDVYVAVYEKGPAWVEGKSLRESPVFEQHLQHLRSLGDRAAGAGPFEMREGDRFVGLVIFLTRTPEEAQQLAEADPFVKAGYTRATVRHWRVDTLKGCF